MKPLRKIGTVTIFLIIGLATAWLQPSAVFSGTTAPRDLPDVEVRNRFLLNHAA